MKPKKLLSLPGKMNLNDWIMRGFWAMGNAVAVYVGSQIRDMGAEMRDISANVGEMNTKLAKYIERSEVQTKEIGDLKINVSDLKTRIQSVELVLPNMIKGVDKR